MAFPANDKQRGDVIRSEDWNDSINEILRLESDKLDVAGGAVSGALTVADALGVGTAAPAASLHVEGEAQVGSPATQRRLTIYGPYNSGTQDGALVVRYLGSSTYLRADQNEIDCTGPLYLNYFSSQQVRVGKPGGPGIYVYGDLHATGNISAGGTKSGYVTDSFRNASGEAFERGDVLVLAEGEGTLHRYGKEDMIPVPEVVLATEANDARVCGIVAELLVEDEPEVPESVRKEKKGKKHDDGVKRLQVFTRKERSKLDRKKVAGGQFGKMVTLGCFAVCKVDASAGEIRAGDLLTTSPRPGHAQKVNDRVQAIGAILGKALGPLKQGTGTIPVLVMLQ